MSNRLSGKVCIITGTGGSMGREAALTFAREGALVVGCDLQVDAAEATVEAVRAAGGTTGSLQPCQLNNPAHCPGFRAFSGPPLGCIYFLFHNAPIPCFNSLYHILHAVAGPNPP